MKKRLDVLILSGKGIFHNKDRNTYVILHCEPFLRSIRDMSSTVAGPWVVPYSWKDPYIWDPSMNRIHSSKWNELWNTYVFKNRVSTLSHSGKNV